MTERSIFIDALDIDDPAARAAYLDRACGPDDVVRRRVERLLQAHTAAGDFLRPPVELAETPDLDASATTVSSPVEGPGSQLGPYTLVRLIGEGGMGAVYLAEQEQPVRRQVALKVIKPGMDSRQVIARFEVERQALALMDHPHIAKVLDAGTTDAGRPYFVMELVQGVPITKFCDEMRLTVRERLELFIPVCQAVQHAHQKGVIHRDLKPSNILVALYDGRPVPKVIDFGVAKALDQRLTDQTFVTGFGQMVGTLEYMAPEQARLNALDIDTRSDVYSLGVLLYELLTGTTPFDRKRLRGVGFEEVLRILREEEPPAPSSRLATAEDFGAVAVQRQTEPGRLSRLMRGDLDWIVLRALEKDRNRRYETATGLARDLQRYLADEPVQAGPPSAWYRVHKFGRRHRVALVAASLVATALVTGTAVAAWQAVVATRAHQEALAAAAAETKAKEMAEAREAEMLAVLKFVEDKIFAAARPKGQAGGIDRDVTLRQALEAALAFVDESFANDPLIEARLRMTLGISFWYLGEARIAGDQYQKARTLYAKHLGPNHLNTLRSAHNLANTYHALGRYADAARLHEETLALRQTALGPDHLDVLSSMHALANSYHALGRHTDALQLREQTSELRKARLGLHHPDTLASMHNLANSYHAVGRYTDALQLHEETLALRQAVYGPDHAGILSSMADLARTYSALGRHTDALKLRQESLALHQTLLGPDHPDTLLGRSNLAVSYAMLGRHDDARQLEEETLALRKAKLGPDHADTLSSMNNLANNYHALGRKADALRLREELLPILKAKRGPDHPETLRAMHNLAISYAGVGRQEDALKLREETLALRKARLGADHPDTLRSMSNLALSYADIGRHAEALALYEETLKLRKAKLGPDHPDTLASMDNVAGTYFTAQRWADAESVLRKCLTLREQKQPDDWPRFHTQSLLGAALLGQRKYAEAEPMLVQGYTELKQRADTIPSDSQSRRIEALERLVQLYEAWDKPDEAARWRQELEAIKTPSRPPTL